MAEEFLKNIVFSGEIEVLTGLHIGGGNESVKIGGIDNPVARTTFRRENEEVEEIPYIPGSSLKGKIRNLVESYLVGTPGITRENVDQLFGSKRDADKKLTRLLFRDCLPTIKTLDSFESVGMTEIKAENTIGNDMEAKPRFIERVRPFSKFSFECILTIYRGDNEELFKKTITEGFKLLEQSYIGGSGTRGYGKVKIVYEYEERDRNFYMK